MAEEQQRGQSPEEQPPVPQTQEEADREHMGESDPAEQQHERETQPSREEERRADAREREGADDD